MDLIDQRVKFKICDIYHPDPTQVLLKLHGDDLLVGKVVYVSDSGVQQNIFVVVEVEGIADLIVVPIERTYSVS